MACAIDWNCNADIQVCLQRREIDIRKHETGSEKNHKILEQYRELQKQPTAVVDKNHVLMQSKIHHHKHFCLARAGQCLRSMHQTIISHLSLDIKVLLIFSYLCFFIACGRATAQQTQPANAVMPAGISLNWEHIKEETINSKRTKMSLDGIWRFIPAVKGVMQPPKLGWNYILSLIHI